MPKTKVKHNTTSTDGEQHTTADADVSTPVACTCPACRKALITTVPKYNVPKPVAFVGDVLLALFTLTLLMLALTILSSVSLNAIDASMAQMATQLPAAFVVQFSIGITAGLAAGLIVVYPKFHSWLRRMIVKLNTRTYDPVDNTIK